MAGIRGMRARPALRRGKSHQHLDFHNRGRNNNARSVFSSRGKKFCDRRTETRSRKNASVINQTKIAREATHPLRLRGLQLPSAALFAFLSFVSVTLDNAGCFFCLTDASLADASSSARSVVAESWPRLSILASSASYFAFSSRSI